MKTRENDPRLPAWVNRLLNQAPFLVDMDFVYTIALGYGASDDDPMRPNWLRLRVGKYQKAMFWNAPLFVRLTWSWETSFIGVILSLISVLAFGYLEPWMLMFCFGWWGYVRWTPERTLQVGLGHKLNGRYALIFRPWHSDARSAEGELGPNFGQQTGWMWGPH